MAEFGSWEHREGMDAWLDEARTERGVVPFCSFCGSVHPGKFLELLGQGWALELTAKNYKAYLHEVHFGPMRTAEPGEELPITSSKMGKFYYQHFTEEQQQNFVDLYNSGGVRFIGPGRFQALPFFMRVES